MQNFLLIIQKIASKKIGEAINKILIIFSKLSALTLIPKKIDPKNKLPTSPINILAGLQLKIKKRLNAPTSAQKNGDKERKIIEELNKTIILPAKRPSIPSTKLKKLIIEIPTNPIKNCRIIAEFEKFESLIIQ